MLKMNVLSKPDNKLIFLIYDGTNYAEWAEIIELVLMTEDLWGIVSREEKGSDYPEGSAELRRFIARFRRAYSIISLNCSSTSQEILRKLGNKDPHLAWKALKEDALSKIASNKLVFMDKLLDVEMELSESIWDYETKFNFIVAQLTAMNVEFDRDLLLAIFLRGVPSKYKIITTNIRHTVDVTIEEAVRALVVEERALKEDSSAPDSVLTVVRDCKHCGKRHNSKDCWFKFAK